MCPLPAVIPRVYIHTLGCPKNEADSRTLARRLSRAGAQVETDPGQATHILINTCGFIVDAKEESIDVILDACREFPDRQVMVVGCLVERYHGQLERSIPEVAGWFGVIDESGAESTLNSGKTSTPGSISALVAGLGLAHELAQRDLPGQEGFPNASSYAYLKISDGCDRPCTFCAIPSIKGSYRVVDTATILAEAEASLASGARELVLVGQDTAIWEYRGLDLRGLIDRLAGDDRVRRIRLMYLQPEHVTDALLRLMAEQPKLCRYLDVPFQHAHPEVLSRMGRAGDALAYLDLLERARRLMPDVSVRSTFIVGFPGETEEHFDSLMDFVERAGFDHGGAFVYSPEEGTPASELRPRVKTAVALDRLNVLTHLLAERAEEKLERLVGSRVMAMVDSLDPEDAEDGVSAVGRTTRQAPEVDGVTYIGGDLPDGTGPGDELPVTVGAAVGYDLLGTVHAS